MSTASYSVRFVDADAAGGCPVCGEALAEGRGPRVFCTSHDRPLCRGCGKRLAPDLGALLDLAATAARLSGPCRHLLTPPLETLLDLARAAENYATVAAPGLSKSGESRILFRA